ncbi:glycosyltransferase family 4 protein [Patescibacteria group bacterium]
MEIAVFSKKTTFHKGYGGLETLNKVLCEGLVKKGHKVTVFSPKWEFSDLETEENGVKYVFVECVYRMGPVFGFFGTFQKDNWVNKSAETFENYHKKNKFDVVLAQSSAGLGVIKKKEEYGIKAVSISHGSIIGEYKTFVDNMRFPQDLPLFIKNTGFTLKNFFRRQRDFIHGSNKIAAVSNFVKQALIDETFVSDEKIEVIYNGVDPSMFFKKEDVILRGKKILFVSQIIKSKGVLDIIKMFKSEELSELSVDLIGGGDLLEECQEATNKDNGLKGRVTFLGKVPYEDLVQKYFKNPEYGIFIFPTKRFEGLPMVLIEAMFSGLPIVAYGIGGVGDAVKDGKNGYLIELKDISAFKEKVVELVNDDEKRNMYGMNALKMAYENFTREDMLNKYEKILQEVLK